MQDKESKQVKKNKVLFVWEFGGHLGHIMNMLPLASELQQRGFEVSMALKDLSRANVIYDRYPDFTLFQAPIWTARSQMAAVPPKSLAQVLQRYGYKSRQAVESLARAWLSLYQAVNPDLVVYDYAFTAQLAFRGLNAKQVTMGSGFFTPSFDTYTACFWQNQEQEKAHEAKLLSDEMAVLEVINAVCRKLGKEEINYISDLNKLDANYLSSFPELDHYGQRPYFNYVGPVIEDSRFPNIQWPQGVKGKKIFAYLKPAPVTEKLLSLLAQTDCHTEVFMPGLSVKLRKKYERPNLRFSLKPFDVVNAGREADLAICHGGHGTAATLLLCGCPLLLLPQQAEQYMLSLRTDALGVSETLAPSSPPKLIGAKLKQLLTDPSYKNKAGDFAEKYRYIFDRPAALSIAGHIEELMAGKGSTK